MGRLIKDFKNEFDTLKSSDQRYFKNYFSDENSNKAHQFLSKYFLNDKNANTSFIQKVANANVRLLLMAIRVNYVPFIKEKHWQSIWEIELDDYGMDWLDVLEEFRYEEETLWNKALNRMNKICSKLSIDQVLIISNLWYESKRNIIDSEEPYSNEYYCQALNYLLSYYFYYGKHKNVLCKIEDEFMMKYMAVFSENKIEKSIIWSGLDALIEWLEFIYTKLEVLLDSNTNIRTTTYGFAIYNESNKVYLDWVNNKYKYDYIYNYYTEKASIIVNNAVRNKSLKIPNEGIVKEYNRIGAIESTAVGLITRDLHVWGYDVDNRGEADVDLKEMTSSYGVFVTNFKMRFIDLVDNPTTLSRFPNWKERLVFFYGSEMRKNNNLAAISLRWDKIDNWNDTMKDILPELSDKDISNIRKLLSFDTLAKSNKPTHFERFNAYLDIRVHPYLLVNDWMFSYTNVIGETSRWGFALLANALNVNAKFRDKLQQKETKKMESYLAEKFKETKVYKHVCCSFEYHKKATKTIQLLQGDIDTMVYHNGYLLLIELKRSKIRLKMKEAWDEEQLSILPAVKQLRRHQELLKYYPKCFSKALGLPETFDWSNVKILPLIVSTSLEHDGEFYGEPKEIQKVSYFEVLRLLDLEQTSLKDLDDLFKTRWYWKNLRIDHLDNSSPIVPVIIEKGKEKVKNNFYKLLDDAEQKAKGEKYQEALEFFFKALEIDCGNPDVRNAIGVCYSKVDKPHLAINYYERGLEKANDDYKLLFNLKEEYTKLGEYAKTLGIISKILDLYGMFENVVELVKMDLIELKERKFITKKKHDEFCQKYLYYLS